LDKSIRELLAQKYAALPPPPALRQQKVFRDLEPKIVAIEILAKYNQ